MIAAIARKHHDTQDGLPFASAHEKGQTIRLA